MYWGTLKKWALRNYFQCLSHQTAFHCPLIHLYHGFTTDNCLVPILFPVWTHFWIQNSNFICNLSKHRKKINNYYFYCLGSIKLQLVKWNYPVRYWTVPSPLYITNVHCAIPLVYTQASHKDPSSCGFHQCCITMVRCKHLLLRNAHSNPQLRLNKTEARETLSAPTPRHFFGSLTLCKDSRRCRDAARFLTGSSRHYSSKTNSVCINKIF